MPAIPTIFALVVAAAQAVPAAPALLIAQSPPVPQEERVGAGDGSLAFVQSAVGATVGSAVGIGVGLLAAQPHRCPQDDVACILSRLAYAGVFTVAGSSVGAVVGGRRGGGDPSIKGAVLGAVAGAALGVGLVKILEDQTTSDGVLAAAIVFTVPQGLLAATGAWLFGGST